MKPLPPIPTPLSRRWREFRVQVIPVLFFLGALAGVAHLWRGNLAAPTLQGEVESIAAQVTAPHAGVVLELKAARFQTVAKGEALAVVQSADPRIGLALIQSELDVLRTRLTPQLSGQRNATDLEQLRLELLLRKVQLATTRINLQRAENEHKRNEQLFREKLISDDLFDLSAKNVELLRIEVNQTAQVLEDFERGLERLGSFSAPGSASADESGFTKALQEIEGRLGDWGKGAAKIELVAPMDGMVSAVVRQPGENVAEGDVILSLRAAESDRIVGYLRQPFPIEPRAGMPVEVRTRSARSASSTGRILHVGAAMEPITNSLALIRPGTLVDMGLPVEISLPPGMKVRPGELVDLILRTSPSPKIP